MKLDGNVAVVTGGGDGMGRALVVSLARQGCSVAACDVDLSAAEETRAVAMRVAARGVVVTTFRCDVSDEAQVQSFARHVAAGHELSGRGVLLFNNAGIGGGNSFVTDARGDWERTFSVCWHGCYYSCRAFLPLLLAAPQAYIVNTSSSAGFYAGAFLVPNTAYSTAKFAIKGFTEALINDMRLNAPHVKVAVVMPGQVGTGGQMGLLMGQYGIPTLRAFHQRQAKRLEEMKAAGDPQVRMLAEKGELAKLEAVSARGALSDEALAAKAAAFKARFRARPVTTAAAAVETILAGVKADEWRILVGRDAVALDEAVRARPLETYNSTFSAAERRPKRAVSAKI